MIGEYAYIHTHGHLPLQCSETVNWNFSGFDSSRTKRQSKRLYYDFFPSAHPFASRLSPFCPAWELGCHYSYFGKYVAKIAIYTLRAKKINKKGCLTSIIDRGDYLYPHKLLRTQASSWAQIIAVRYKFFIIVSIIDDITFRAWCGWQGLGNAMMGKKPSSLKMKADFTKQ